MLRHNDIEQTRPARHGWCAVLAAATVCLAFGAAAATAQGQPNDREPWRSNETEQDERQPQAERGERGDRPAFDRSRRGRGPGGLGRMFQNRRPFDSREVFHMGEALEMDESQIVLVRAMYDGFSDAVDAEREATREKMRSMRDDLRDQMRNGEGMTDMVTRMTDMQRQSEQRIRDLEASFLEGVRTTVLTEEQQDDWERYVRDQRRRSSLSAGARLPGEGIDLVEIVDDLDLTEEEQAEIAPDLENYVNELDQALIARNQFIDSVAGRVEQLLTGDAKAAEATFNTSTQKSEAIREINTRYLETIASKLSENHGSQMRSEFNETAYPRIYRNNQVDRYLTMVRALESLNEEQRDTLEAIESDYEARVNDINRQLVEVDLRRQEAQQRRMLEGMRMFAAAGDTEEGREEMFERFRETRQRARESDDAQALSRLRDQRRSIESSTLDAVVSLLTAEQLQEAPRPEVGADRDGEREAWIQRMRERREEIRRDREEDN